MLTNKTLSYPITLDANIEDILSSTKTKLNHLLLLNKYEILSDKDMGCDLKKLIFKNLNNNNTQNIINEISNKITYQLNKYLPYVKLKDVIINTENVNMLEITIGYTIDITHFGNYVNNTDLIEYTTIILN